MTQPSPTRPRWLAEAKDVVGACPVPHHESPALIRRRRIVVAVVLVIGAGLLGYSLTRPPGDASFYWLTLGSGRGVGRRRAGVRALAPGLHSVPWSQPASVDHRNRSRAWLLGAVFIVGGLIAREIPAVREYITRVLEFANYGPLLLVTFITVVNGVAEEMFFRGALYTALGRFRPILVSTVLYVIATGGCHGQPDAGFRGDHPRHGVRGRAPSDRGSARTDADPLLLGSGHGARTAPDVRRLTQRMRQLVLPHLGRVHRDRRQ